MKKSFKYNEYTGLAIQALMQSAEKDEFADQNPPSEFAKPAPKKKITNLKEWREFRQKYKDKMEPAVKSLMESAKQDIYVDKNKPM